MGSGVKVADVALTGLAGAWETPLVVTKAEENLILELGGKAPLAQLQEVWQNLGPRDQPSAQTRDAL